MSAEMQLNKDSTRNSEIHVTKLKTIPPLYEVEQGGQIHQLGELRDFRWSPELKSFMPDDSIISISWVKLGYQKVLDVHRHPIQSMMVVYAGSGTLIGDIEHPLEPGDVIVVPPGCGHGFIGGKEELYALSIQFGEGLYTRPEKPRVKFLSSERNPGLLELLAYNEKRLAAFQERPFFRLLTDGTLEDEAARTRYLRHLQIWVEGNQRMLLARQASCVAPKYQAMFLQHLGEEWGHDLLHGQALPTDGHPAKDSVLQALTDWFTHQMHVLDDAEKTALVHLVIESASQAYHRHAAGTLGKYVKNAYYQIHAGTDAAHAEMGISMLENETPRTYELLKQLVGRGWDMIEAMTDRIVEITRNPTE